MAPGDVDEMPSGMVEEFVRYQNKWIRKQQRRR
jgi:hypothetical protein